jgi:hypothetical protein
MSNCEGEGKDPKGGMVWVSGKAAKRQRRGKVKGT